MEDRIEMYEILNEFTSQLTAPSVVGDGANWKKSVSEGLGALIEPYIKMGALLKIYQLILQNKLL